MACILIGVPAFVCASCTASENVTVAQCDGQQCLLYQDEEYYASSVFTKIEDRSKVNERYITLGWYYSFPLSTYFYSETAEKPVYIFAVGSDTNVYLKKDYDYKSEIFVIADTSKTIVFSEALTKTDLVYDVFRESIPMAMYAEKYPNLKLSLRLFLENDHWYASFPECEVYRLSEAFVSLLKETGVIEI